MGTITGPSSSDEEDIVEGPSTRSDVVSFGKFTPAQRDIVALAVLGCTVHDFGAGNLELAHELVKLGANRVVAIDASRKMPKPRTDKIETVVSYFEDYDCPLALDIAFMSYPANRRIPHLVDFARRSRLCIYLGVNTGGSACGSVELFEHFLTRRCLAYVPDRKNTLIILGDTLTKARAPHGEEIGGLDKVRWYTFDEAEAL